MRLHDLRRHELGMPPRPPVLTSYMDADQVTDYAEEQDDVFSASGTVLVAALGAQPRTSLIAGALVTIVLTVVNDGTIAARNVHAFLALPAATTYRAGTFSIDGKAGSDGNADELFENGTAIGDIEPGARRTVMLKLVIEAGLGDITLSPHLSAAAGAVLGLRAIILKRAEPSGRNVVAERPFYESDTDELASEAFTVPANPSTITALQPAEYPPIIIAVPANPPAFIVQPAGIGRSTGLPAARDADPGHLTIAKTKAETVLRNDAADRAAMSNEKLLTAVVVAAAEPMPEAVPQARIESVRSIEDRFSVMGQGGPVVCLRRELEIRAAAARKHRRIPAARLALIRRRCARRCWRPHQAPYRPDCTTPGAARPQDS
jgi:hypothetical protein